MQLNPSEISELIKERIKNFESAAEARTEGTVVSLTDGIARIHGLADVMSGEMIEFPGDTYGMALNLERDSVGAVILGAYQHLSEGDTAKCTGRILEVPVGEALLGRVVNSLGEPIDGKGPITTKEFSPIEKVAPGVCGCGAAEQHSEGAGHDRRRADIDDGLDRRRGSETVLPGFRRQRKCPRPGGHSDLRTDHRADHPVVRSFGIGGPGEGSVAGR